MNRLLLIEGLIRQTMALIARLATMGGVRTPLSHLEEAMFLDLVRELNAQGVGKKVIADMLGMSLRNYHLKMGKLAQNRNRPQMTLWQTMWQFIDERQPIERRDVLQRFRHDDSLLVRGILNDLVTSGMRRSEGKGPDVVYRSATLEDMSAQSAESLLREDAKRPASPNARSEGVASMVWMHVFRNGCIDRNTHL